MSKSERILVSVPAELMARLEEWETRQSGVIPARSKVLRAALRDWLDLRVGVQSSAELPLMGADERREWIDRVLAGVSDWQVLRANWTRSDVRWREDGNPFERKAPGPDLTVRAVFRDPSWEDPRPEGKGDA